MIELILAISIIFVVYVMLPPYILTGMGLNDSSRNFKRNYVERFKQFHLFMGAMYVAVGIFFAFIWAFNVVLRAAA